MNVSGHEQKGKTYKSIIKFKEKSETEEETKIQSDERV
jgi:hypothetical protein